MKKMVKFLAITTAIVGVGLVSHINANAKTTYQYSYKPYQGESVPYFTKTAKVANGGAIWNVKHTKKIGNMKNYPYSRWMVEKVYIKKKNGKVASYYYQAIKQNSNGKKKYLMWSGYLNKAITKTPNQFKTDAAYSNYIQTADSQRLTRAILKLFPNTQVSVKLSQLSNDGATYAPTTYSGFNHVINIGAPGFTSEKDKVPLINPAGYLWDTKAEPVNSRAKKVDKLLTAAGYPAAVRKKMTAGKIGIFIADYVAPASETKSGLPSGFDGDITTTIYKIVYGEPTK